MPRPPKHPSVRARRNNPRADFVSLPAGGRKGRTPAWPLVDDVKLTARLEHARDLVAEVQVQLAAEVDGRKLGGLRRKLGQAELTVATVELMLSQSRDAEVALWRELWRTPQAVMWEQAHAGREVAQYVRWKVRGEQGDLEAAKEARMLSDRLGLNPLALLRLRLEIAAVDEAEDKGRTRRAKTEPVAPPEAGPDPRSFLQAV